MLLIEWLGVVCCQELLKPGRVSKQDVTLLFCMLTSGEHLPQCQLAQQWPACWPGGCDRSLPGHVRDQPVSVAQTSPAPGRFSVRDGSTPKSTRFRELPASDGLRGGPWRWNQRHTSYRIVESWNGLGRKRPLRSYSSSPILSRWKSKPESEQNWVLALLPVCK